VTGSLKSEKTVENVAISIPTEKKVGLDKIYNIQDKRLSDVIVKEKSPQKVVTIDPDENISTREVAIQPAYKPQKWLDSQNEKSIMFSVSTTGVGGENGGNSIQSNENETNNSGIEDKAGDSSENSINLLREDPLLSLPSHLYTIQLMGANDKAYLLHISELYDLREAICFRKKNGDSDWYVLIYKLFSDRAKAMACVETLAPELKANHPWIRMLGDIQKEVSEKGINAGTRLLSTSNNSFGKS
jgi:septal ring-binding cell division protein DamX